MQQKESLANIFRDLWHRYAERPAATEQLWQELATQYSSSKRHYHTLEHLSAMYAVLAPTFSFIHDRDSILFALFYHDYIYNTLKQNNELRSAAHLVRLLEQVQAPLLLIKRCRQLIEATHQHAADPADNDLCSFLDADLSILGQPAAIYDSYTHAIRKEYAIYPDFVYQPARRKVVQGFLNKSRIYTTPYFFDLFEKTARENLERELQELAKK